MQVERGLPGGAIAAEPRVILSMRVRPHHVGSPSLRGQIEAERVATTGRSAEDEDRVGVTQRIDLRTHIDRQPGVSAAAEIDPWRQAKLAPCRW